MTNDLEERLRDELGAAERWAPPAGEPPAGLFAAVHRRRRRRSATLPVLALAALVIGAALVSADRQARVASGGGEAGFARPAAGLELVPESVPASPLGPRKNATAVWTGTEFVVWGGHVGRTWFSDGAAYDPLAGRWRMLPRGPVSGGAAAWDGHRMIVVDGKKAAALDPATGAWRDLAIPPVAASWAKAVVVGGSVVVGGGVDSSGGNDGTLLVYDPAADRWATLPTGGDRVTDLAAAGTGVALVTLRDFRPVFKLVSVPDGHVEVLPTLRYGGRFPNALGVGWTGSQVLAFVDLDRTTVGVWRPGSPEWEQTRSLRNAALTARYGNRPGTVVWRDGWVVSVGNTGVYAAAPATGRSAKRSQALDRVCTGDAAVAVAPDALLVWGASECSAASGTPPARPAPAPSSLSGTDPGTCRDGRPFPLPTPASPSRPPRCRRRLSGRA